jgi:hypothetical protein
MNRKPRLRFPLMAVLAVLALIAIACGGNSPTEREVPTNDWRPITEDVNGELTEVEGIPLLTLWGTHREMGYAHGYLYAPEVIEYLDKNLEQQPGLVEIVETQILPNIHRYDVPADYLLEMEGFLAGLEARAGGAVYVAGLERTLTINDLIASTIIDNIEHLQGTHCTSFSAWGAVTAEGRTITGRNYEQPDDEFHTDRFILIVRKAPPGSGLPSWVSVELPGAFGAETAMNSDGVTFATQEVNLIRATSATTGFCPEHLLQRRLLESARAGTVIQDVSAVLQDLYTNGGEANLLSWPSGQGACSAVFEVDGDLTTGHGFTVRQAEPGLPYMIQTNQFYERLPPEASSRYALIRDHFDGILAGDQMPLTVEGAWEILGQVPVGGDLIIQHAVVFEPDEMLMHVAFAEPGIHATARPRVTLDVAQLLN